MLENINVKCPMRLERRAKRPTWMFTVSNFIYEILMSLSSDHRFFRSRCPIDRFEHSRQEDKRRFEKGIFVVLRSFGLARRGMEMAERRYERDSASRWPVYDHVESWGRCQSFRQHFEGKRVCIVGSRRLGLLYESTWSPVGNAMVGCQISYR